MHKKPLIDTNFYLRIPDAYRKSLITNVSTSTAIETSTSAATVADILAKAGDKIFMFPVRNPDDSSR